MQSFKKALLYGLILWLTWTSITVIAYETLPKSLAGSAFYVSMKTVLLAVFATLLTIRYMKMVGGSGAFTVREGVATGLLWTLIMIALDMSHYVFMSDNFRLGTYLVVFASTYLVLPAITISLMGWLRYKR